MTHHEHVCVGTVAVGQGLVQQGSETSPPLVRLWGLQVSRRVGRAGACMCEGAWGTSTVSSSIHAFLHAKNSSHRMTEIPTSAISCRVTLISIDCESMTPVMSIPHTIDCTVITLANTHYYQISPHFMIAARALTSSLSHQRSTDVSCTLTGHQIAKLSTTKGTSKR